MEQNNETIPEGFYKDPKTGMITCKQCSCGKKNQQMDECETCKPKGMLGWICPVCGRGNSPFSSSCPCVIFQQFPNWPVTCGPNQTSNIQQ